MEDQSGPAFPIYKGELHFSNDGMSLRDWFAGQFLKSQGRPANFSPPQNANDIAAICYAVADAMLKEREK